MSVERRAPTGLGRGLAALIPQRGDDRPHEIPLSRIVRNPYQPRRRVDEEALSRLAESIAAHGVLQPVLVTETASGYELIAGERRVRAAEMAGLQQIPAMVREAAGRDKLALALVENVQRADLNPLEEARAYRQLADEFGLAQEEIARRVGRGRSSVANTLRLLDLSQAVQEALAEGHITEGHGRAIGGIEGPGRQDALLGLVVQRSLSVRQTEELVRRAREEKPTPAGRAEGGPDPELERVQARLRASLGTKVTLTPGKKGGRITIEYYDTEDLTRLVALLAEGVA